MEDITSYILNMINARKNVIRLRNLILKSESLACSCDINGINFLQVSDSVKTNMIILMMAVAATKNEESIIVDYDTEMFNLPIYNKYTVVIDHRDYKESTDPATYAEAFRLIEYFHCILNNNMGSIYEQKPSDVQMVILDNTECSNDCKRSYSDNIDITTRKKKEGKYRNS